MFLPLGDTPNPRGIPVATYLLLAANVAVYVLITLPLGATAPDLQDPLLREYVRLIMEHAPRTVPVNQILSQMSAYDVFVLRWGFRPADPHLVNLFAAMFLHAGFAHLAGNMLFLWIYGDNVEHRLGPWRYLLAYLGTGAAATLFHAAFDLDSPLPLVGASGAISGVLGFYFLWFPRNQVRLFVFLFPFLFDVITLPARVLLGLYLIVDNLLPFLLARGGGGGVAHGAHIGGFIAGLAVAWLLDRRELSGAASEYGAGRAEVPSRGGAIHEAIEGGRLTDAAQMYFSLAPEELMRVLTPADSLTLAGWLKENGHERAALVVYRRHLRDYPAGPGAAEASLGAGLIQLETFDQPTAAYQHLLDALDHDPSPEIAARVHAALHEIATRQKFQLRGPRARRDQ